MLRHMIYFKPTEEKNINSTGHVHSICVMNNYLVCSVVKKKEALTWGGSPQCKDANFPPHLSHAVD